MSESVSPAGGNERKLPWDLIKDWFQTWWVHQQLPGPGGVPRREAGTPGEGGGEGGIAPAAGPLSAPQGWVCTSRGPEEDLLQAAHEHQGQKTVHEGGGAKARHRHDCCSVAQREARDSGGPPRVGLALARPERCYLLLDPAAAPGLLPPGRRGAA